MKSFIRLIALLSLAIVFIIGSCEMDKGQTITADLTISNVAANFFNQNPALSNQSELIVNTTNNFFNLNAATEEFRNKKPLLIEPIYAYGIDGVAYYELWLTEDNINPKGWILISATENDFPITAFSHNGIPYSKNLTDSLAAKGTRMNKSDKIYRFGASYYTLENSAGRMIEDYGQMPTWISNGTKISNSGKGSSTKGIDYNNETEPVEGVDYTLINNYSELKSLYAKRYFTESRRNTGKLLSKTLRGFTEKAPARDGYIYRYVSGQRCYFTQIPPNSGYNPYSCYSGCNNNAWMNLFGWWDRNMSKGNLIPTTSTGETSPIYRNTSARRDVVDPAQMWIRATCSTSCSGDQGSTSIKNVWKGYSYTTNKGYGYSYWYRWCTDAGDHVDLADILTDSIANNYRPAHVGANSHAWLAYGWAQWDTNTKWTWAYCYPGWNLNDNDDVWISWYDINCSTKCFVY